MERGPVTIVHDYLGDTNKLLIVGLFGLALTAGFAVASECADESLTPSFVTGAKVVGYPSAVAMLVGGLRYVRAFSK